MAKHKLPTIIDESRDREAFRAKHWRTNVMRISKAELAALIGYTEQAVYLMERGINSQGMPVRDWVWTRYKMACAGAEYARFSGKPFDWEPKGHG